MKSTQWKRLAILVAGFVLSIVFLWLALRQVDQAGLHSAFYSLRIFSIFWCAIFLAAGVAMRSVRWGTIARLGWTEQTHFFRASTLGVFSNLIFPIRAGEVVRVFTLTKLNGTSLTLPIASALLDRLADLFMLLLAALVVYWISPIGTLVGSWMSTMFIVASTILVLVALYARSYGFGEALVSSLLSRTLRRWPVRPDLFLSEFRTELHHLLKGLFSLRLVTIVLVIMVLDYAAFKMLLDAFQLHLAPEAPLVLWVFLAAGSALPSAPGYVGVYQVAAVWALSLFAVPASVCVALATTLQLTILVVSVLMVGPGAWSICRRALNTSK